MITPSVISWHQHVLLFISFTRKRERQREREREGERERGRNAAFGLIHLMMRRRRREVNEPFKLSL